MNSSDKPIVVYYGSTGARERGVDVLKNGSLFKYAPPLRDVEARKKLPRG